MPTAASTLKILKAWQGHLHSGTEALEPLDELQYIVRPMLPMPSLAMFYGISGSHKTNLVMDLAICVTQGLPWLAGRDAKRIPGFVTHSTPVLWIDADSGQRVLQERFGAALRARHVKKCDGLTYASFLQPTFSATDDEAVEAMIQLAKAQEAHLIVFDNLGTISGGAEENASAMIKVMSSLRYISESANAAVVVIHHDSKFNAQSSRQTPRGHTSIEAALSMAVYVTRDGDTVNARPTKIREAPFPEFSAKYNFLHRHGTYVLEETSFTGIPPDVDEDELDADEAVSKFLKKFGSATQTELVEILKTKLDIGRKSALMHLERQEENNFVKVERGGERNASTYSLKEDKDG